MEQLLQNVCNDIIFRQKVDGDFLAQIVLENMENGGCIFSCFTQILDPPIAAFTSTNENIKLEGESITFDCKYYMTINQAKDKEQKL